MKRAISLALTLVLLLGLCLTAVPVKAADSRSKAGSVATSSKVLNVRTKPSTASAVLTTLSKGSLVTLISKTGAWWQVEYSKDRYGYCHENYIAPVSAAALTVSTQSTSLNVRSGPGPSYSKLDSLWKGETVLELSRSNGWSRILYHGTKTGYVSSQYLGATAQAPAPDTFGAVSLSVPSFKQTDSRWANVKIGSSGKTMGKIGCATTAIAMMESYRLGSTIYPDAMAKKLKYTASGNVYWPENYTVVTNGSGYLAALYQKLREGKPILFGAKNSSGSQHWVVITGFTGGNQLSAAGFAIHDPGTASRTNLQQFLNQYPIFYKYFYY